MKKLLAFFVIYCGLACNCFAQQAPGIEWQNTIGGSNDDALFSISETVDHGFIIGGYSLSDISGDKNENCKGSYDYWIVKTNSAGVIQWQNTIGGNGQDQLFMVEQTTDKGYIMGGYSNSNASGDKTENSFGGQDYWIIKSDSLGNMVWQNTIGGNGNDQLVSLLQCSGGGYLLGGYSRSNISGDKIENSVGVDDYWIIKINSTGAIQWQNTIGGNNNDEISSVIETMDKGYLLCGSSNSSISGDKTENSKGGFDYWILKTDSSGSIQWQKTIGGNNDDKLFTAKETSDNGYILGGYSLSSISGDKGENNLGVLDYWVVKIDSIGNILWQNTIGGSSVDWLRSIEKTTDGGFVLGGYSDSNISGDKIEGCIGNWDFWLVKIDSLGNLKWQNTIGGNLLDGLFCVKQCSNGGYILGGTSASDISGDKTENSLGYIDYWIVKLFPDTLTSTTNIHSSKNNFKIFPNPATDYLSLTLASGEGTSFCLIKIYDVFGNLVLNKQSAITNYQLSVSNFSSGVYFVEVEADKEVYRSKFVKTANR
ncbi:MAG: T9SS type A sorting domain-containing protein [Bacteroidetes bacterium]|nr:T9SS type A sorting domain-containing protein [Bacteroidota bacterium]